MRKWIFVALVYVLAITLPGIPRARANTPPRIAFTSHVEGASDIYVTGMDGSGWSNLTRNKAMNYFPDWSPDGQKIVFQQQPNTLDGLLNGHFQIYVMDADGSNPINLSNDPVGNCVLPAWSPDGRRIAFSKSYSPNSFDVYVMNADGSNPINLTHSQGTNISPRWSPDGRSILFESNRESNSDVYRMDADGSNAVRLTNSAMFNGHADWSPDGKHIVLVSSNVNEVGANLYMMEADGSHRTQLTHAPLAAQYPRWSPDGQYITFIAYMTSEAPAVSKALVYVMNADGSNVRQVAEGFGPAWVRGSATPLATGTPPTSVGTMVVPGELPIMGTAEPGGASASCEPAVDLDNLKFDAPGYVQIEARLRQMFTEDQTTRVASPIDWSKVAAADRDRRAEVWGYLQQGKITTAAALYHAAMIFQHGECPVHYQLANVLAEKAMKAGYEEAKWLYAATLDRYLMSTGQPQKFGTQFRREGNGPWALYPVDPSTTDAERAKYNVPSLAEAQQHVMELNER